MDTKFGVYSALINCSTELFLKKIYGRIIGLITVFVKVALEITKGAQDCV